eukprot:363570-Chlamydomonas_euryale.AAC.12
MTAPLVGLECGRHLCPCVASSCANVWSASTKGRLCLSVAGQDGSDRQGEGVVQRVMCCSALPGHHLQPAKAHHVQDVASKKMAAPIRTRLLVG